MLILIPLNTVFYMFAFLMLVFKPVVASSYYTTMTIDGFGLTYTSGSSTVVGSLTGELA